METKKPRLITRLITRLVKSRAEAAIAALAVVVSIAAGSAVLAQDSSATPSTPPAADKPAVTDRMGMGSDGNGMMGMMSGMQKMKCCAQGMGHSDHGASEKQDEKK
jgi:hypothetical protein